MRFTFFILALAIVAVVCASSSSSSVSASSVLIPLGSCSSFALMAGTQIAANGVQTTIHIGSIGVGPGDAVTGVIVLNDGSIESDSASSIACAADELIAYAAAKGATCGTTLSNVDIGGRTFTPGVYCTPGSILRINAGIVTLDGEGDDDAQFIFQSASSIITATATSFILQNGAQAKNVFWLSGAMVSIGYSSSFVGTILAYTAVTIDHDATLLGRAYAQTAITFAGNDEVTMA